MKKIEINFNWNENAETRRAKAAHKAGILQTRFPYSTVVTKEERTHDRDYPCIYLEIELNESDIPDDPVMIVACKGWLEKHYDLAVRYKPEENRRYSKPEALFYFGERSDKLIKKNALGSLVQLYEEELKTVIGAQYYDWRARARLIEASRNNERIPFDLDYIWGGTYMVYEVGTFDVLRWKLGGSFPDNMKLIVTTGRELFKRMKWVSENGNIIKASTGSYHWSLGWNCSEKEDVEIATIMNEAAERCKRLLWVKRDRWITNTLESVDVCEKILKI